MARRPFFSGNYGSALGSTANAANLIARAGETQGQMFANMGAQIGGMIQQYGLNKEKRNKLQATLEGQLSADPSIVQQLTMTGDEDYDKKNMKLFDKVQSGDASIADLERANGLLAGKTTQENAMMKKSAFEMSQVAQQLLNENSRLRNKLEAGTLDAKIEEQGAVTSKAKTDAAYAPDQQTSLLAARDVNTAATRQRIEQSEELFPLVKQYKEGQISYQDLLKKRLATSQTSGLTSSNSDRYREVSKEIDGIMDDFATVVDGEKLTIEDMIKDITDTGEIILRDDISVRAESSIPRLEDLLKEKLELDQSRILRNVPLTDGSRRDMTQSEFNIMQQKDREKEEQARLLEQAQMQAGSGYNVKQPTMFR